MPRDYSLTNGNAAFRFFHFLLIFHLHSRVRQGCDIWRRRRRQRDAAGRAVVDIVAVERHVDARRAVVQHDAHHQGPML